MILVNVLLFVAIASGVVMLMLSREDVALQRSTRVNEASRAMAAVRGGELSAITALRRDALIAPATDNNAEAWGRIGEKRAKIAGGSFEMIVADAQGRFNLNALASGDPGAIVALGRIVSALGLPPEMALGAAELIRSVGPLEDLAPLAQAGLPSAVLARLSTLVTVLPQDSRINANSINEDLLGILIGDPIMAHALIERRNRTGVLQPADFAAMRVTLPSAIGFTSNFYWTRTRVTIGETAQQRTTLLERRRVPGGIEVVPIAHWMGSAMPLDAPTLPDNE